MSSIKEAFHCQTSAQWDDWRWQLKNAVRTLHDLKRIKLYSNDELNDIEKVLGQFKTLVSPYYLSLIDQNNPHCPIRKQALPNANELVFHTKELKDPIGDKRFSPTPILVHRYRDRVLLFPTFECPMFCRYCFRKDSLNEDPIKLHKDLPQTLIYLKQHPEIKEVILSGGDPLMLSTRKLTNLVQQLIDIGIKYFRFHSRMLVTLPQRITQQLVEAFKVFQAQATITVVTHFNHPKELTKETKSSIQKLKKTGIFILNQSVLLKDINHETKVLKSLFYKLHAYGVLPYYLHHPDLTRGTQHFRCSLEEGLNIYRELRGQISGYLLPRYMIDIPNGGGKVEVDSSFVRKGEKLGHWWLTSPLTHETQQYFDLAAHQQETDSKS